MKQSISSSKIQEIPPLIHFIWLGGKMPELYLKNILNIARVASNSKPQFEVILWTDNESLMQKQILLSDHGDHHLKYVKIQNALDVFGDFEKLSLDKGRYNVNLFKRYFDLERLGSLANYAAASDILRYLILYLHGGNYLDTDSILLEDKLDTKFVSMKNKHGLFLPCDHYGAWLNNDKISCSKNNGFMLGVIGDLSINLEEIDFFADKVLPPKDFTKIFNTDFIDEIVEDGWDYQEKRNFTKCRFDRTIECTGPGVIDESFIQGVNYADISFYKKGVVNYEEITVLDQKFYNKNHLTWVKSNGQSLSSDVAALSFETVSSCFKCL